LTSTELLYKAERTNVNTYLIFIYIFQNPNQTKINQIQTSKRKTSTSRHNPIMIILRNPITITFNYVIQLRLFAQTKYNFKQTKKFQHMSNLKNIISHKLIQQKQTHSYTDPIHSGSLIDCSIIIISNIYNRTYPDKLITK